MAYSLADHVRPSVRVASAQRQSTKRLRCCAAQAQTHQQQHQQLNTHQHRLQGVDAQQPWHRPLAHAVMAGVAAASLCLAPAALAEGLKLQAEPVYDAANVLQDNAQDTLSRRLRKLEQATGYHVRVWAQYAFDRASGGPSPRSVWGSLDDDTVVVIVDPSSPNVLNFAYVGQRVQAKLHRPFFTELQSRYGNLFFVRERGEAAALLSAVGALAGCLEAPEGCKVVPGLPQEQYAATLTCSIAGGLVAGFVARLEPQGIVQRRWVWLLLFSPLWGSLFVNFGLGPIVSRTSDVAPIAANTAAFLAAGAAPALLQRAWDGGDAAGGGGGGGAPGASRTRDS